MAKGRYVAPAISETAFSCPHCGTLTKQRWYLYQAREQKGAPGVWTPERVDEMRKKWKEKKSDGEKVISDDLMAHFERRALGLPFIEHASFEGSDNTVYNLSVTRCDECTKLAVWLYDRIIWPQENEAPEPAADMPEKIVADYMEAGSILGASPRGAAALLRLCVQKLCRLLLGDDAKDTIDKDIATLVSRGLDKRVEMALDIVRVVGNESVHPGKMDMKDDRATAEELFGLVNVIVEMMITQPKRIAELYSKLPPEKLKGSSSAMRKRRFPSPRIDAYTET